MSPLVHSFSRIECVSIRTEMNMSPIGFDLNSITEAPISGSETRGANLIKLLSTPYFPIGVLKKLVFKAPFRPFYHRWNKFSDILKRQKKEDHPGYLFSQLLYKVLYAELRGKMAEIKDHMEQRIVTYNLL